MTAILNDITQQYQAATVGWYSYLFPIANHLFGLLAVIEIAWSGLSWALEKQDMTSLWVEFLKRIIFLGFFYAILLHGHIWIPAIIKSFMLIGSGASHITKLDPSSIFDQGISIANSVLLPLEKKNLFSVGLDAWVIGLVTAITVVLSFTVIAGELVITLVESYLIIGAGVLFLGLGSSRWTTSFTTKFLNYALSIGCKLFFLYLIIGVGANMAAHWGEKIVEGGLSSNMVPFLEVMGGALIFVFIAWSIPNKAASLMIGSVGASFAGLFATTQLARGVAQGVAKSITTAASGVRQGIQTVRNVHGQMHKSQQDK
jgi:type IV secretion system protein TrbL